MSYIFYVMIQHEAPASREASFTRFAGNS